MSNNVTVTFIGTTSGGGPTETRNCSSLVVDALGTGSLWMVDCAEGTVRQFEAQPYRPGLPRLRMSQVSKIFITHMHADHTMGTLTFLRNILGIPKPKVPGVTPLPPNRHAPRVEIFGPRGIRRMLRMLWHMTHTHSEHPYVVNELLFPGEQPSIAANVSDEPGTDETDVRRESECIGRDIWCDENGFWRGIVDIPPDNRHHLWGAIVDAGPIQHRDPCIGYVIREIPRGPALSRYSALPRKLVILGDTYDASALLALIHDDPPSFSALPEVDPYGNGVPVRVPVTLLVHEATDCYLPPHIDPQGRTGKNRTKERVDAKTIERGHSTPAMAGSFARKIAAERLVLNHIGARFPAPDPNNAYGPQARFREECMREIEHQAADGWNPKRRVQVQAAWDYLSVSLPPNQSREPKREAGPSRPQPKVVDKDAATVVRVDHRRVERSEVAVSVDVGATAQAPIDVDAMFVDEPDRGHMSGHSYDYGREQHGDRKRKTTGSGWGGGGASGYRPPDQSGRREYSTGNHADSGPSRGRYEDKRPRKESEAEEGRRREPGW